MKKSEEKLKDLLIANGIPAETVTVVKNGIQCTGYRLEVANNRGIAPIIYYSKDETMQSFLDRAKSAIELELPIVDIAKVMKPEFIRKNTYICVQRMGNEDIAKRQCLNLELYLRLKITADDNHSGTIKLSKSILTSCGVDLEDAWSCAAENTRKAFSVAPLAAILGISEESDLPLYVVTTKDNVYGASALAFPEIFKDFCLSHDVESCYILPSSTEEVIVCPCKGDFCQSSEKAYELAQMVYDINSAMVDPQLRLDPVCYHYSVASAEITIAASAV